MNTTAVFSQKLKSAFLKIKWTLTENYIILVRKIKKSEDFLQIFGMWIVEEISENLWNSDKTQFCEVGSPPGAARSRK